MRLIDADAIEWLQATGYVTVGEEEFGERTYVFIPINSLDELPTINAVPVIRCENCKYSRNPNNLHFYCMCSMWERPVEKKGFCWLAESEESKC